MKRYFDFSKGFFHKGVAHLYSSVAVILSFVNVILLLTSNRTDGVSISILNLLFIPIVITSILVTLNASKGNKVKFRLYSMFTIGYLVVAIGIIEYLRGFLSTETIKLFFENYLVVDNHNILPAVLFVLSIVVIFSIISILFMFISLFLILRNIQPIAKKEVVTTSIEITTNVEEFKEEIKSE